MVFRTQTSARPHAGLHVRTGRLDQLLELPLVDRPARLEFRVPHFLARPCEKTVRIGQIGTTKEADIDVRREGIDLGTSRIRTYRSGFIASAGKQRLLISSSATEIRGTTIPAAKKFPG